MKHETNGKGAEQAMEVFLKDIVLKPLTEEQNKFLPQLKRTVKKSIVTQLRDITKLQGTFEETNEKVGENNELLGKHIPEIAEASKIIPEISSENESIKNKLNHSAKIAKDNLNIVNDALDLNKAIKKKQQEFTDVLSDIKTSEKAVKKDVTSLCNKAAEVSKLVEKVVEISKSQNEVLEQIQKEVFSLEEKTINKVQTQLEKVDDNTQELIKDQSRHSIKKISEERDKHQKILYFILGTIIVLQLSSFLITTI